MEGTLSVATTLLSFPKTLTCSTPICRSQFSLRGITTTTGNACVAFQRSPLFFQWRIAGPAVSPVSVASFSSSGGGDEVKENPIAGGGVVDDVSPLSSDVIVLDVRGMMCGGCASSVKRILENQSQVSSASVDHTTETAIVWPVSEAKVTPNWQKVIGEEIAKNLTSCGFDSNLRGEAAT